jgi:glycosyltransferase involved in cell wall biosynthesis
VTPSVIYISYDGASEPLGRSQVVSYLLLLARTARITLISFEKPGGADAETSRLLEEAGVRWRPLEYHKRPPVFSTMWDIGCGAMALRRELRRHPADIVHVRSYVAALIAVLTGRRRSWRLLFDIRGFWVDERVDGGMWKRDGILHRIGKRCERWFFRDSDAVVTLTRASVPQIREWLNGRDVPVRVIPTCAPVETFIAEVSAGDEPKTIWCGSIGGMYRFDLAVKLACALNRRFVVLTRQVDAARQQLGSIDADIREVRPEEVPHELAPGDVGLCLYGAAFSDLARAPTRLAEYLAAGMPVAVTPGIGDLDEIVERHRLGVVLRGEDDAALARAAEDLLTLAKDPELPDRARQVARERFTLESGAEAYREIYSELTEQR